VEALREDIRPQVAPLLETRDLLNELTARAEALEELEAANPIWTRPLVELAALLPEDTYLTALFASGDTVEIEAAGARAGEAIQALRESGLFEEVRLQGIVERKLDEGETVEERFRLWALLPSRRERGRS
jgi:Tfp pilus assembly protein PilN